MVRKLKNLFSKNTDQEEKISNLEKIIEDGMQHNDELKKMLENLFEENINLRKEIDNLKKEQKEKPIKKTTSRGDTPNQFFCKKEINKKKLREILQANPGINITKLSSLAGISRQAIYKSYKPLLAEFQ